MLDPVKAKCEVSPSSNTSPVLAAVAQNHLQDAPLQLRLANRETFNTTPYLPHIALHLLNIALALLSSALYLLSHALYLTT